MRTYLCAFSYCPIGSKWAFVKLQVSGSLHAAIVEHAARTGAKFWDFSQAFEIH